MPFLLGRTTAYGVTVATPHFDLAAVVQSNNSHMILMGHRKSLPQKLLGAKNREQCGLGRSKGVLVSAISAFSSRLPVHPPLKYVSCPLPDY